MKDCPYCGEEIQDAARKCRFCGEFVTAERPRRKARSKSKSNSTTWIIVAVIAGGAMLVVVPCLIALLLPAVQQAREAARRSTCKNNLKQIALAIHSYHDTYRSFPPAYIPDENGQPMHSWRVLLLPFLNEGPLYDTYDFSQSWDSDANRQVLQNMPEIFRCPSDPAVGNTTNYAAVFGENCVFSGPEPLRFRDITDGSSNTVMVGEVSGAGIPWTQPVDVDIESFPDLGDPNGFSSKHIGGVHFVFVDGSVRFIQETINPTTLQNLFILNDGQRVGNF